jgi:hypothetical protein
MEDNNNKYDFEQFLRNSVDDFKMIPSRKIWYGIYNNMHPDRKWPSIAVCLVILSAIMFVGVANNNAISNAARKNTTENLIANNTTETLKNNEVNNNTALLAKNFSVSPTTNVSSTNNNVTVVQNNLSYTRNTIGLAQAAELLTIVENNTAKQSKASSVEENTVLQTTNAIAENSIEKNKTYKTTIATAQNNNAAIVNNETQVAENTYTIITNAISLSIDNISSVKTLKDLPIATTENNYEEKSWKEDYAFRNKPLLPKLKEGNSISYYVTPSIGYRSITTIRENKAAASASSFIAFAPTSISTGALNDAAALNLEVGAIYQHNISVDIRIKAGVQANYTNYISKVTSLNHSTQTNLAVVGQQNTSRSSFYYAKEGDTRLNNTTWQLAVPVGLDVKIAGSRKIKWYIGATAQPTYILGGSGYVLSADAKNYISETPLLRKLNLNTAVETFLSFKPSSTVTLNVGPQFRYQLFSTYKNTYNYSEKLYNLGVKVGISTKF